MTTLVAIRVPGHGAVMIADGKISDDNGRIWSTTAKKLLQLSAATVGVAGNLLILDEIKRAKLHTAEGVKEFLRDGAFVTPYDLVCYDHLTDGLWSLDQNGMYVEYPHWVATGIGGQIAAGAILMASPPVDLDEALSIGRQAIRASSALNGHCGGITHWFICRRVQSPDPKVKRRPMEFNGAITQFDVSTGLGRVRIGKRVFDFQASVFSGEQTPSAKMKVSVEISDTGHILSVRPRKS